MGKTPEQAAIDSTHQVWAPVLTSVLTTVIAFAPLLFMSGIFGKFARNIPIGVIIALIASLVECFFILPHHVAAWINPKAKNKGLLAGFWETFIIPEKEENQDPL